MKVDANLRQSEESAISSVCGTVITSPDFSAINRNSTITINRGSNITIKTPIADNIKVIETGVVQISEHSESQLHCKDESFDKITELNKETKQEQFYDD